MLAIRKLTPLMLIAACGCTGFDPMRSLALDSYNATHRPNAKPTWGGDPYAFGGIGDGSGGLKPRSAMATSSNGYDFRKQPKQHGPWKSGDDQRPMNHVEAHHEAGAHGAASSAEQGHSEEAHNGEGQVADPPEAHEQNGH